MSCFPNMFRIVVCKEASHVNKINLLAESRMIKHELLFDETEYNHPILSYKRGNAAVTMGK